MEHFANYINKICLDFLNNDFLFYHYICPEYVISYFEKFIEKQKELEIVFKCYCMAQGYHLIIKFKNLKTNAFNCRWKRFIKTKDIKKNKSDVLFWYRGYKIKSIMHLIYTIIYLQQRNPIGRSPEIYITKSGNQHAVHCRGHKNHSFNLLFVKENIIDLKMHLFTLYPYLKNFINKKDVNYNL